MTDAVKNKLPKTISKNPDYEFGGGLCPPPSAALLSHLNLPADFAPASNVHARRLDVTDDCAGLIDDNAFRDVEVSIDLSVTNHSG